MSAEYDASNIRVLEGVEAVRTRPGMYIGSTGKKGLHFLVFEMVDSSIEEAIAGYCNNIEIVLNIDGSVTVSDDGRGIEDEHDGEVDILSIEKMFTTLHIGKYRHYPYRIGGSLYGVGLAVISALSSYLEVKVWRDRTLYKQRFERGIAVSSLENIPSKNDRTGTMITFLPDVEIFKEGIEFEFDRLSERFRELAFLHAGLKLSLIDRRSPSARQEKYDYPDGLRDYLRYLNRDKQVLNEEIFYVREERDKIVVEVALQWCRDDSIDCLLSYANTTRTIDGGKHVEGLKYATTQTINTLARQQNKLAEDAPNLAGECIRAGLVGVISVLLPNTDWAGPTRTCLANSEAKTVVNSIVAAALTKYLTERSSVAERIIDNAIEATKAAEIARQNRESRRQSKD